MAITIVELPAPPQCEGAQWFVGDRAQLVMLTGMIMLGRAEHASRIISGAQGVAPVVAAALKQRLRRDLIIPANADPWHRDGLLFESICWLAAKIDAGPNDVISDPHRKATQQGADGVKVQFDPVERQLSSTTIYEYKCTDKARRKFKREVLPAFTEYLSGVRDDQLSQITIALLARFELTDEEQARAYERLVLDRPMAFEAALTVVPGQFPAENCVRLFKSFDTLKIALDKRRGVTFPVPQIRPWFDGFANEVWDWIDTHV